MTVPAPHPHLVFCARLDGDSSHQSSTTTRNVCGVTRCTSVSNILTEMRKSRRDRRPRLSDRGGLCRGSDSEKADLQRWQGVYWRSRLEIGFAIARIRARLQARRKGVKGAGFSRGPWDCTTLGRLTSDASHLITAQLFPKNRLHPLAVGSLPESRPRLKPVCLRYLTACLKACPDTGKSKSQILDGIQNCDASGVFRSLFWRAVERSLKKPL